MDSKTGLGGKPRRDGALPSPPDSTTENRGSRDGNRDNRDKGPGDHLREWRQFRRMSQLDLALDAEISARHLSFVETGRARPSRALLHRLFDELEIPLRARNRILLAAGLAPEYQEAALDSDDMADTLQLVAHLLRGHEPFPALVVDRHWNMVAANRAIALLTEQIAPALMQAPVNVLRLALHPDGLAPQIVNYEEWRGYILHRLERQIRETADPVLEDLYREMADYPGVANDNVETGRTDPIALPMVLDSTLGRLTFMTTVTVFGTPRDVTLSELALETFLPADKRTAAALRDFAEQMVD